jgi:hypothetical protein
MRSGAEPTLSEVEGPRPANVPKGQPKVARRFSAGESLTLSQRLLRKIFQFGEHLRHNALGKES